MHSTRTNERGFVEAIEQALYRCDCCGAEWEGEITPLWTWFDLWPLCCGAYALLVALVQNGVPIS